MRIVSKLLATVIFAIISIMAISPLAAVFVDSGASNFVFITAIAVVGISCLTAKSGRRSWGRGFLICGAMIFALPLTMTVLSGVTFNEVVSSAPQDSSGATAVGAALGSGLMVGASAFFGFFLGTIFLVIGAVLCLGGTREVVVVQPAG